jgi:hypothetical protein
VDGQQANDPKMINLTNDSPPSLAEAEALFGRFLERQGYPSSVYWVNDSDLSVDSGRHWSVRRNTESSKADFAQRYSEGIAKGLGIEIVARCASQERTFATIFIPDDAVDAQYHMVGRGLKMCCPIFLLSGSFV